MYNKPLKRPMFRKGGPAMEGIMEGIKPRENFAGKGASNEVLTKNTTPNVDSIRNYMQVANAVIPKNEDALSDFLLQLGPELATRGSTGSIVSDVLGAAKAPLKTYLGNKKTNQTLQTQIALAGLKGLSKESLIAMDRKIKMAVNSGQFGDPNDPETTKKVTGMFIKKELQGVDRSGRYEAENRMDRVKAFTKGFADPATGYGVSLTTAEMMANIYVDKISKEKNLTKDFDINKPFMNPQGYQSKANGNLIIPSNELDEYIRNKQYSDLNGNYFLFTGKEFQPISSETGK